MRMQCALFFFFSSRRRHTRCSRDWSSDVCSSDLFTEALGDGPAELARSPSDRVLVHVGADGAHGGVLDLGRRSEEHTSELQSRLHLVCRLLLEKKKTPTEATLPPRSAFARVPLRS